MFYQQAEDQLVWSCSNLTKILGSSLENAVMGGFCRPNGPTWLKSGLIDIY